MTTYTLSVDSASSTSTFTAIDLRAVSVLPVSSTSVASTFTNVDLRKTTVLPVSAASVASTFTAISFQHTWVLAVDAMSVASTFTNIVDRIHESFYWLAGAVAKTNVRSNYRMGGLIGWNRFADHIYEGSFSAKQSLVMPEDVNADDRFGLER